MSKLQSLTSLQIPVFACSGLSQLLHQLPPFTQLLACALAMQARARGRGRVDKAGMPAVPSERELDLHMQLFFLLWCFRGFLQEHHWGLPSPCHAEAPFSQPLHLTPSTVPGCCCRPSGHFSHPCVHVGRVTLRRMQGWIPSSRATSCLLLTINTVSSTCRLQQIY